MADKEIRKDDSYTQEFTVEELENVSGGDKISYGKDENNRKRKSQNQVLDRPSQGPVEVEEI